MNQCSSTSVSDALYNLDQGTPSISNGFEYIQYDPYFEPDMLIIVVHTGIDYTHPEFDGIHYELIFDAYPFDSLGDHGKPMESRENHCMIACDYDLRLVILHIDGV